MPTNPFVLIKKFTENGWIIFENIYIKILSNMKQQTSYSLFFS